MSLPEFPCTCVGGDYENGAPLCIGCQANEAIEKAVDHQRKTDIAGFNETMRALLIVSNEDDQASGKTLWIEFKPGEFAMVGTIRSLDWAQRLKRLEQAKKEGTVTYVQ